jgi:hypothetical protein
MYQLEIVDVCKLKNLQVLTALVETNITLSNKINLN